MSTDKRKYSRREIGLPATVTWPRLIHCTICDISQTGARLRAADLHRLPKEFDLSLSDDIMRKCRVVWRNQSQAGVEFLPNPNFKPTPTISG
ncbi:MAG: PilZ domain-containing protein [Pseudolabrys sp.]